MEGVYQSPISRTINTWKKDFRVVELQKQQNFPSFPPPLGLMQIRTIANGEV